MGKRIYVVDSCKDQRLKHPMFGRLKKLGTDPVIFSDADFGVVLGKSTMIRHILFDMGITTIWSLQDAVKLLRGDFVVVFREIGVPTFEIYEVR